MNFLHLHPFDTCILYFLYLLMEYRYNRASPQNTQPFQSCERILYNHQITRPKAKATTSYNIY